MGIVGDAVNVTWDVGAGSVAQLRARRGAGGPSTPVRIAPPSRGPSPAAPPPPPHASAGSLGGRVAASRSRVVPLRAASGTLYTVFSHPGNQSVTTAAGWALVRGLHPGTSYFFSVQATDAGGGAGPMSQSSAYPCYLGTSPPPAPGLLLATGGPGALALTWTQAQPGAVVK